jgi:inosine-uridine nucleoside N-ribohydrolase
MSKHEARIEDRIPVILDTDIGDDIDDTWALAMLLKSPELDLKLVVGDTADTGHRAKIVAKMLEVAKRTDVAVGIGIRYPGRIGVQGTWADHYDLKGYPGKVYEDGVAAIIETIMGSSQPVTLICIGPVPNIAEALRREPRIAGKARFVGMHGSVRLGYGGSPTPCSEYNVRMHTRECQEVFRAGWDMTITPLDTCGLINLTGEKYQAVRQCKDPVIEALMENYLAWTAHRGGWSPADVDVRSTTLFDTVAVYLAFCQGLAVMEDLPIRVTDAGMTVIDEKAGNKMHVATGWKDLGAYEDLLVKRLVG